jgi:hypothetical protein
MLFRRESDFLAFLQIYERMLKPYVRTYAWCLAPEQAMVLVAISEGDEGYKAKVDKLLKRYRRYHRRRCKNGAEIEKKVIHLPQPDEEDLRETVLRLHCFPLLEGLGSNFVEYPWTSYLLLAGRRHTWLKADDVMRWFGGLQEFMEQHFRFLEKNVGEQESGGKNFVNFIHRKE